MSLAAAIVPHAPLLVEGVLASPPREVLELRAAVAALELGGEVVVVVSPHAARSGVYAQASGSLAAFGLPHVTAARTTGPAAGDLAAAWGQSFIEGDVDHGVLVPLALGVADGVVVIGVGLSEQDVDGASAKRLAGALAALSRGVDVAVVASVNTSAALTDRAPLTERLEARAAEARFLSALRRDVGEASALLRSLRDDGGSCALGPLRVLAELCAGRAVRTHAYGYPFGVGYLVGSIEA